MDLLDDMVEDDRCVYWANVGNTPGGDPIYDPPEELKCRWEDISELFISAVTNGQESSRSIVYVRKPLTIMGALCHCSFGELTDVDNPMNNEGTLSIRSVKNIPTLDQDDALMMAYL